MCRPPTTTMYIGLRLLSPNLNSQFPLVVASPPAAVLLTLAVVENARRYCSRVISASTRGESTLGGGLAAESAWPAHSALSTSDRSPVCVLIGVLKIMFSERVSTTRSKQLLRQELVLCR